VEAAVAAMREGAADFVTKPFSPETLRVKLEKVLEHRADREARNRLSEENQALREEIGQRYNFGAMVGCAPSMRAVFETVAKVAASESAVMIYGESGTGKELVARAIHEKSPRAGGPFVKVNCGAIPAELVESELFGHEKGAFTGAVKQRKGRFELAKGGTVFLDEIGDIPLPAQVSLLRVLQEREFDRVGGEETIRADVRVVAATHRSLAEMVAEGRFREDLFYRLEVIPVRLPPLRERREDIPLLVEHFLQKKSADLGRPAKPMAPDAVRLLARYAWPGNVRELENVIERTLVLSDGAVIGPQDLPLSLEGAEGAEGQATGGAGLNDQLAALEKRLIAEAMVESGGNKTQAAGRLGIKTSALYYKLEKYGL
jgi:two-component system response regulator HydG